MAGNKKIDKRKNTYREAEANYRNNAKIHDAFHKLNQSIPKRNRKERLTTDELNNMSANYKAATQAVNEQIKALDSQLKKIHELKCTADAAKMILDLDRQKKTVEQNLRDYAEYNKKYVKPYMEAGNAEKLKKEKAYLLKIRKTLSKDFRVIGDALKMKEAERPTVTDLYENARSYRMKYDLKKAKSFGGLQSTRYLITVKNGNGEDLLGKENEPVRGFFTISEKDRTSTEDYEINRKNILTKYGKNAWYLDEASSKRPANNAKAYDDIADVLLNNRSFRREVMSTPERKKTAVRDQQSLYLAQSEMFTIVKNYFSGKETKKGDNAKNIRACMKFINSLDTPQKYHGFIDYLNGKATIRNAHSIKYSLGIKGDKADKRGSAMSVVADVLGIGNVIAKSYSLQILGGPKEKPIKGTFIEFANGTDRRSTKPEDIEKFKNLTPKKIEDPENMARSRQLKKDIANLQILDFIVGNPDRHGTNIMYRFDDEGNLVGIQGIDNDTCLGTNEHVEHLSGIGFDNFGVIPKETADAIIECCNTGTMDMLLYGYDLNEEEKKMAIGRLLHIRDKIIDDRKYYEEHANEIGEGELVKGRIKVVSDEEWDKYSIYNTLFKAGREKSIAEEKAEKEEKFVKTQGRDTTNLFESIGNLGKNGGMDGAIDSLRDGAYSDVIQLYDDNNTKMKNVLTVMNKYDKKDYGSNEFKEVKNMVLSYYAQLKREHSPLLVIGKDGKMSANDKAFSALIIKIGEGINLCDAYLGSKNEASINSKSHSGWAYNRYHAVKEAKKQFQEQLKHIKGVYDKFTRANNATDERKPMREKANAELNEIKNMNKQKAPEVQNAKPFGPAAGPKSAPAL